MSNKDDHVWDRSSREGRDAFQKKFEEWERRDWTNWLAEHLTFPFKVTREEDDDDAYFLPAAAKAPFRLGHTMEILSLAEEDIEQGIMLKAREKGRIGYVPLCDVQVRPKADKNFWPVKEYAVWSANRSG